MFVNVFMNVRLHCASVRLQTRLRTWHVYKRLRLRSFTNFRGRTLGVYKHGVYKHV